jgi:hypothetical protein
MGQLTIYLDDESEAKMRAAAKAGHISQSKWVARLIREKTADVWPESVIKLAGSWPDLPTAEEIRNTAGLDARREEL